MSRWLAARGTSPDAISVAGMVACVAAGVCLAATGLCQDADPLVGRGLWLAAAVLVQIRLACNMLDGMVAIERRVASPVGELFNEIPDRVSDWATLVGLGYAAGSNATLGHVAAWLAVFVAYVRSAVHGAGAPADFCGPMAKPQRMFLVTVLGVVMALVPTSWLPWTEVAGRGLPAAVLAVIAAGCVVTAVRRIARATQALRAMPEAEP